MREIQLTFPDPDESTVPPEARVPVPVSPAQARDRLDQRRKFIRASQAAGLTPMRPPRAGNQPGKLAFEDNEVVRIPCRQSDKARELLATSPHQGRLLPQALSEAFGELGGVKEVLIGVVPKHKHFTVYEDELHPVTNEPPVLIVITVVPLEEGAKRGRFFLNHKDIWEINPRTREPYFRAVHCAGELARLYDEGVR